MLAFVWCQPACATTNMRSCCAKALRFRRVLECVSPVKLTATLPLQTTRRWSVDNTCSAGNNSDQYAARRADLPQRQVALTDVSIQYARSSGKGGQNVNKVSTKVDMRLDVFGSPHDLLPDWVKDELLQQQAGRINNEGELVVSSQRTRSQSRNRDDALNKIRNLIANAAYVPPPPSETKEKRIRGLVRRSNERRLQHKKRHQAKKAGRRVDWS